MVHWGQRGLEDTSHPACVVPGSPHSESPSGSRLFALSPHQQMKMRAERPRPPFSEQSLSEKKMKSFH